ncbi:endo-alpha-N-acetylgalactosaminidase family protein [Bifidobacterium sp. B4114]|uniref:endo-alpha-N-acetylgalactosaminidase family protein n=2 Tax=Bifidobacterium TaxID=1678 RepID=UPI002B4741A7|nr:endo-alpha-N-acetylgalactosaminidase family protein [Bifidobacterium sp. B4114]
MGGTIMGGNQPIARPGATDSWETLHTQIMEVRLRPDFPSVIDYRLKTPQAEGTMLGQVRDLRLVAINGIEIELGPDKVELERENETSLVYRLHAIAAEQGIDAVLAVRISVEDASLSFKVISIGNQAGPDHPVQTVAFPGQCLISVTNTQADAEFTGARMSADVSISGDVHRAVTGQMEEDPIGQDYMYGFLSADGLSAGLWSNSEHDGTTASKTGTGGAQNTRVMTVRDQVDGVTVLGLTSAPWIYNRVVQDSRGRSYTVGETNKPAMAVALAGDLNDDGVVNWQDGAIAFRHIMNNPYGSDDIPDQVARRIAMNFGSQAQNPFMTTLDNVKRVALATDGLGQSVLLKGYGNEGHDSGHPDYDDIGPRMGGVKDMNALMDRGKAYGARFGVHVNVDEMYPEAKAFSEDMIRRDDKGGLCYGWNWLDQTVGIDGIYDLASGARRERFAALAREVGDRMDFVYVDVWGDGTSGEEDSWQTRQLSKILTDNGWGIGTEYASANEYDAAFQHWSLDLTYGSPHDKGENSQVMRFLRNHQKDSWIGDHRAFGGAANAPLLDGYSMKDFEGWQGRNDFDAYMDNLYTCDLSTKFIQHFRIMAWYNDPINVDSVRDLTKNQGNEQIELVNDQGDRLVISRGSNEQASPAYRERTMRLNDRVVLVGELEANDPKADKPGIETGTGAGAYLLPWVWDANTGDRLDPDEQKLYHWNTAGGSTTWELPELWRDASVVIVYRLTDQGRSEPREIPVVQGSLTLDAKPRTPYLVCRHAGQGVQVDWSGEHLVDAGFNGGERLFQSVWSVKGPGRASITKGQCANPMLRLEGSVCAVQPLTNLVPGKRYALYLGLDNRGGQVELSVDADQGGVLARNMSGPSIAKNYVKAYAHNTDAPTTDGSSYFQNAYLFFTAPKGGQTRLALAHEGDGAAYLDDIRLVENEYDGISLDQDGHLVELTCDFEDNVQGIWPFVVAGAEGVEDNRIHLAQLHEPFTQAGWDVKRMDDVLQGDWSLKVNGLTGRRALLFRTIPQNVPFAPGRRYRVSFDYQCGSDGIYALATGRGEYTGEDLNLYPLHKALGVTARCEFELTGDPNGDTWFGIYSTDRGPDLEGSSGSEANMAGYQDLVLDNLRITSL